MFLKNLLEIIIHERDTYAMEEISSNAQMLSDQVETLQNKMNHFKL